MARLLDQILVIDVESTCWEGAPPPGQMSEIIEVGVAAIDADSLRPLSKRSILIKPTKSEVSEFCTQLTTLTASDLENAGTLQDAVQILKKGYRSQDRLWASWGDYDRRQFERVCREADVAYPFGLSHLNVKSLFAVALGLDREVGMEQACQRIGQFMEGTHHRGADDAWNIAGILCRVLSSIRGSVTS